MGSILFTESTSFSALPESDDLHDRAERLELGAGLWIVILAEKALPGVVRLVIGLGVVAVAHVRSYDAQMF